MSTPTKFTRFPHHHTRQHHLIIISDTVSPPPQQQHTKKSTHTHKINLWKFKNNNLSSFLFTYLYKKTTTYPHPTQKLRQFNVLLDSLSRLDKVLVLCKNSTLINLYGRPSESYHRYRPLFVMTLCEARGGIVCRFTRM